ncbi:18619_t:CDS:2 [Funneliformis geosporum]|uniref:18619_t:CDS:1 n=1 Tax=Funneliformis geosporum TaxID=1117311 RepID=A0A9W4WXX4_9GLOM|nr:18619_t:CDS:2 [Funneliformis geosporum]
MNSTYTHEIFYPEILETHSINTLSETFEQLKSLYQNDDNSDTYSSNELPLQSYNEILTSAQIENFRSIYDNIKEENEDEEQKKIETF